MKQLNISLIFYPFSASIYKEAKDIKSALEIYNNNVRIHSITKDLFSQLQKDPIDLVFNLARQNGKTAYNISIASICELLELKMIGPSIFTSSIVKDTQILSSILKYDQIPFIQLPNPPDPTKIIDTFILGNNNQWFFQRTPPGMTNVSDKIFQISQKVFRSLHCSDYCKFSFIIEKKNQPILYRINPQPLLGNHGPFAKQVNINGIDYSSFINYLVLNTLIKHSLPIDEDYLALSEYLQEKSSNFQLIVKS